MVSAIPSSPARSGCAWHRARGREPGGQPPQVRPADLRALRIDCVPVTYDAHLPGTQWLIAARSGRPGNREPLTMALRARMVVACTQGATPFGLPKLIS
jgi:hypothetical protein